MSTLEAPTFTAQGRWRLGDVVPADEWRYVRYGLMASYAAIYVWWLRERGLPIDRISVAISVGVFLLFAFVGRPLRTWGILAVDAAIYCVMWTAYERTRDYADNGVSVFGLFTIKFPLQWSTMRDIDRALFLGHDPNVVLQEHFWGPTVRWWDKAASAIYMTHFVLPILAMAVLWVVSHRQWARFIKRFATLLLVGCIMFVILPTAPPWMVASSRFGHEQLLPHMERNAWRGFYALGFRGFTHDYNVALSKGNAVAAMPSLHASFALLVPLFFMQWITRRWVRWSLLLFPVAMLTSLVYLGEHWVIDGLVGWCITVGAFWFWDWQEQRVRDRRAAQVTG